MQTAQDILVRVFENRYGIRWFLRSFIFRDVERLINSPKSNVLVVGGLSHLNNGKLIIAIQNMRQIERQVPSMYIKTFKEDVKDLQRSDFSLERKMNVVERIWRMYPFLKI